jgi:hypothetical protein
MIASGKCARFARPFAAREVRFRLPLGAKGGDMHELPDASFLCRPGDGPRARHVHGLERLGPRLCRDADQIDDDVGAFQRPRQGRGIAQVGLHGMDLADIAHRLQMTGEIGAAHGRADAPFLAGQRPDGVPAEEARAAKHRDEASLFQSEHHRRHLSLARLEQ